MIGGLPASGRMEQAAVGGLVFGSVLVCGQDDFFFIVGFALVMYFNEAINTIQERLNEIEHAVEK